MLLYKEHSLWQGRYRHWGRGGDRPPSFLTHSSTLEYSTVPNKGLDYVSPPQFLRGSTGPDIIGITVCGFFMVVYKRISFYENFCNFNPQKRLPKIFSGNGQNIFRGGWIFSCEILNRNRGWIQFWVKNNTYLQST